LKIWFFFASVSLPIERTGRSQLSLDISLQSGFDQQYAPTQLGCKMSYVFWQKIADPHHLLAGHLILSDQRIEQYEG
jgi:hypothetical protein